MSSKEGVQWFFDGPLNEQGRILLLQHVGLEPIEHELPLAVIERLSPSVHEGKRRRLEQKYALGVHEMRSTRWGAPVAAALVV